MKQPSKKTAYHHGDLRSSLVETGAKMIKESGIEGLSLRKLAERIGVSRTATYHHFNNKNDLLCAIAALGFIQWTNISNTIFDDKNLSGEEKFREFVYQYITFATQNASIYELMFGKTIWKKNNSDQALRDIAYPSFNYQLEMTKTWQQQGLLIEDENSLRLAQVTWGTLHGIVRLLIDGIYLDTSHIDEMCECVVKVFIQQQKYNKG
ncbi:MAG: AcrR family transcriptional regulator [Colwellia sp.]|jgi:AcrR family transcriptional regulator